MAPEVKRNVSPRIYICFSAELFVIRLNSFANLFTVFVFSSKSFVPNTFKNLKEWEVTRERAPDRLHEGATNLHRSKLLKEPCYHNNFNGSQHKRVHAHTHAILQQHAVQSAHTHASQAKALTKHLIHVG